MKLFLAIAFLSASVFALGPCRVPAGSGASTGSQICDSTRAMGLYRDSLRTKVVYTDTLRAGRVGFYNGPAVAKCMLPYSSPPNPVTQAAARKAYDQALQDCLDASGVNLIGTP